jgi:hypothetical protein
MRVKGPRGPDGTPKVDEIDSPSGTREVGEVGGEYARVEPSKAALPSDTVSRVAARLRAGEITVDQAVDILVEDVVERQVGLAVESAKALGPMLRDLLRQFVAQDPYLQSKVGRLGSK